MEWIVIVLLVILVILLVHVKCSNFASKTWNSDTDVVIVTAHYKEDLNWLLNSKHPIVMCDKVGADPSPFSPDPKCSLSFNKGREAGSFLKFIIEYYDALPKHVAFIHGHEETYHQRLPFGILEAIDRAKKDKYGYISLNNLLQVTGEDFENTQFSIPVAKDTWVSEYGVWVHPLIKSAWDEYFKPMLGYECPKNMRYECCAQFIVSRDAILRHPKSAYEKLFKFVTDPDKDDYKNGFVLEFTWHMIFGEPPDMCDVSSDLMSSECTDAGFLKSRFI